MSVPFSLHPHQHLLLLVLLIIAILTGVTWNLSVVLICISLTARDIEHFFIYLLIDCISSVKCLFSFLAHLLIWLFVFLVLSFLSCLHILEISAVFEVIFYHSVGFLFKLLIVSFAEKKLFSFNPSHLLILDFTSCALGVLLREVRS